MKCPHCGGALHDNAAKLKTRRHAKGQCIDCAGPLTSNEKARGNWRCFDCRRHVTVLRRRRQAAAVRKALKAAA